MAKDTINLYVNEGIDPVQVSRIMNSVEEILETQKQDRRRTSITGYDLEKIALEQKEDAPDIGAQEKRRLYAELQTLRDEKKKFTDEYELAKLEVDYAKNEKQVLEERVKQVEEQNPWVGR